jgi:hypothetical protein
MLFVLGNGEGCSYETFIFLGASTLRDGPGEGSDEVAGAPASSSTVTALGQHARQEPSHTFFFFGSPSGSSCVLLVP